VIVVAITSREYDVATKALDSYSPDDVRDHVALAKVRVKLGDANETKKIRFSNKEANVLMDALNECDPFDSGEEQTAGVLSEKLTGRVAL
jgi:hypothetical protein